MNIYNYTFLLCFLFFSSNIKIIVMKYVLMIPSIMILNNQIKYEQ